jgi:hypothetical protein
MTPLKILVMTHLLIFQVDLVPAAEVRSDLQLIQEALLPENGMIFQTGISGKIFYRKKSIATCPRNGVITWMTG